MSMRRLFMAAAIALVGLGSAGADTGHRVLASYPHGAYLENILVSKRGEVLFTSYFARTVEIYGNGAARTFATLDVHPVNLIADGNGYIVLAHGGSFMDGPNALRDTNALIWLSKSGQELKRLPLKGVVFGNGLARLDKHTLLMTDSALGQIWRVDLRTGACEVWFKDDALAVNPSEPGRPGANGLRRQGQVLYVTSSAARSVFRLAIDRSGAAVGPLSKIVETDGADDLAVDGKGVIYLATHGERVVRISPAGDVTTVVEKDVDGTTSTALSRDGKTLYVLGTGGLFEGKSEPAHLVAVPLAR